MRAVTQRQAASASLDERATLATVGAARAVFRQEVDRWLGRIVDTAGNSVLAMFDTAAGAVDAAVASRQRL